MQLFSFLSWITVGGRTVDLHTRVQMCKSAMLTSVRSPEAAIVLREPNNEAQKEKAKRPKHKFKWGIIGCGTVSTLIGTFYLVSIVVK